MQQGRNNFIVIIINLFCTHFVINITCVFKYHHGYSYEHVKIETWTDHLYLKRQTWSVLDCILIPVLYIFFNYETKTLSCTLLFFCVTRSPHCSSSQMYLCMTYYIGPKFKIAVLKFWNKVFSVCVNIDSRLFLNI